MDFLGMVKVCDVVLVAVMVAAAIADLRMRRIPNLLTLPAILVGPIIAYFQIGSKGVYASLAGAGIMILLGIIILMFRLAGGGDAKLLIAVGSLKGSEFIVPTLLFTALAGGVLSLLVLLRQRRFGFTLRNMPLSIYTGLLVKSTGGPTKGNCIPYGVAIAAGSIAALVRTWVKQAA